MKNLILILSVLVLNSTLSLAQLQQTGMTFSLPSTAVKVTNQNLSTYNIAYTRFAHLANIYKINQQVWIGFGAVKNTRTTRDTLQGYKSRQDYDMSHDLKTSGIYYSKIETVNNLDVYFEYHFTKGIGYYGGDLGTIYMMVFDYDKKKMFSGRVGFENQSDSIEAMTIFYDFVKSVSFVPM